MLTDRINPVVEEIDFRQTSVDYQTPKNRKEIKSVIKQKLLRVIRAGGIILFNIDDSGCKYEAGYDPDYKELFDRGCIHQHIWDPEKLLQREIWTQYSGTEKMPTSVYTVKKGLIS